MGVSLSRAMALRVVIGLAILGVAQANWVSRADAATTGKLNGVAFPDGLRFPEGVVVGASGVNLRTTDQGTSWTSGTALATDEDLNAVAFPSAAIGYTVGAEGFISSTTDSGTSWIENLSGTTQELKGVGFFSTSVGCAGGLGTMLCTSDGTTATGATWTAATGFTFTGLVYAVAMASTTVGFAGGSSGALFTTGTLATDGSSTWAQYTGTDGSTGNFYGIAATSVLLACAVGQSAAGGTLIYVTEDGGTNWGAPTTTIPVSTGLFAVAFQPAGAYFKGFAVGRAGVVLTTVDAISATMTWLPDTVAPITSSSDLLALSFPNQYEAYAVGKSGAIMHYDVTAHPTNSPSNAPTFAPTNATNATNNAPTNAPTNSDDDLSDGEIAGIVVGSVAAVAVIAAVVYYLNKKQPEPAAPVVVPPEMTMGSPKADTPPASPSSSSVHNAILNAASRRGAVPNSPPESADPDAVNVDFTIQR